MTEWRCFFYITFIYNPAPYKSIGPEDEETGKDRLEILLRTAVVYITWLNKKATFIQLVDGSSLYRDNLNIFLTSIFINILTSVSRQTLDVFFVSPDI